MHASLAVSSQGLNGMDYKEHIDYDLVESTNPAFGKALVRVNVFRSHRQTVQYIQPQHYAKLAQVGRGRGSGCTPVGRPLIVHRCA